MKTKYCTNCGTELSISSSFCSNCGARQSYIEDKSSNNSRNNSTKMIRFTDAIPKCIREAFNLNGVATRAEYWWFYLFMQLVLFGSFFANIYVCIRYGSLAFIRETPTFPLFIVSIVLGLIPSAASVALLSVSIRRLHDINQTGHFLWLKLIPFFGSLALLIMFCQSSITEDNKYRKDNLKNKTNAGIITLYVAYSILSVLVYAGFYASVMREFVF